MKRQFFFLISCTAVILTVNLNSAAAASRDLAWRLDVGLKAEAYGLDVDANDNVYLVGAPSRARSTDALRGGSSFVRRYSPGGRVAWTKSYVYPGVWAKQVAVDRRNRRLYVIGDTMGRFPNQQRYGMEDVLLQRYGLLGEGHYTRQSGPEKGISTNSGDLAVGPGGSVVVVGDILDAGPSLSTSFRASAFVRKYRADGEVAWEKRVGGERSVWLRAVAVDRDGNVYVGGAVSGRAGLLSKYDRAGRRLWTRRSAGGTPKKVLVVRGYLYVVGGDGTKAFLRKYDRAGRLIWNRRWGGRANDLEIDSAGNIYAVGEKPVAAYPMRFRAYVRKYSGRGELLWNRSFVNGYAYGTAIDSNDHLYVTGVAETDKPIDAYIAKFK